MQFRSITAALGLVTAATLAAPDDWRRPPEPGEAGIMKVLGKLREIGPDGRGYSNYLSQLPYTTRPQDVPVLLRELPKGPTEPLIDEIARYWSADPVARAQRSTDPSPLVRRAVVRAIVRIGRPTADDYGPLADRIVLDDDADVRRDVALAVKERGGVAFAKLLVDRLDRAPPARLAEAVGMTAEQGAQDPADFRLPSMPADAQAVAAKLEQLLAHADPAARAAALSRPPPGKAPWPSPAAAQLADDPDARARLSLAESLRGRSAGASPTGLKLLDDKDGAVRGAALDALLRSPTVQGRIRPPKIVAKLAELASDPDPFVRGRLKIWPMFRDEPSAAPGLVKALAGDRGTRLAALEAMKWGLPPLIGPAVESLLDDPDPVVRAYAFGAAGELKLTGDRAVRYADAALTDADPAVRAAARLALMRVVGSDLVPGPPLADGEMTFVPGTPDAGVSRDLEQRHPAAAKLVHVYHGSATPDAVLDLLGGDPASVDAVAEWCADTGIIRWGQVKPLCARAGQRGGRAAAVLGIVLGQLTRADDAGRTAGPDETSPLVRALRKAAGGTGREANLAKFALRETPAAEAAAAATLLGDPVQAIRGRAVFAVDMAVPQQAVPKGVLDTLDDPDPFVCGQAAARVGVRLSALYRGGPPPTPPEPAATRLDAADAIVRAVVIAESAAAPSGPAAFALCGPS